VYTYLREITMCRPDLFFFSLLKKKKINWKFVDLFFSFIFLYSPKNLERERKKKQNPFFFCFRLLSLLYETKRRKLEILFFLFWLFKGYEKLGRARGCIVYPNGRAWVNKYTSVAHIQQQIGNRIFQKKKKPLKTRKKIEIKSRVIESRR
jgi:hypothetical protein